MHHGQLDMGMHQRKWTCTMDKDMQHGAQDKQQRHGHLYGHGSGHGQGRGHGHGHALLVDRQICDFVYANVLTNSEI